MREVTLVPYGTNILRYLAEEVLRRHFRPRDPLSLAQVTVLFPHRRPALYLRHYLWEALRRPFIPPRIYALEDYVDLLASQVEDPPRRPIEVADQAWLLWLAARNRGSFQGVSDSFERFFPWGVKLASLFEELYRELRPPSSVPYPEGVPAAARAFLEDLAGLFSHYEAGLEARGLTTKGRRFREVAQRVEGLSLQGPVWIVGFYALTASESRLLKHLWLQGAEVLWHADEEDLPPLYRRWLSEWGAEIRTLPSRGGRPQVRFIEAYDLHSEIQRARELVFRDPRPDLQALVLPDPGALIPVLHGLPEGVRTNVTLGYPLERTALAALIRALMRLELQKDPQKGFYHRDYLAVLRHPLVKRLPTPSGKQGRIVLHRLEERIRGSGTPYLRPEEALEVLGEEDRAFLSSEGISLEDARSFLEGLHRGLLDLWGQVETAGDLARCLREVVRFIMAPQLAHRRNLERPLENEFLYSLENSLIPSLEGALFRDEPVGKPLLFRLLERLLSLARTPFEGQPLEGLQVMGLLETRLLSFDRVVVLDVNEGVLPPHEEVDPLLPPSLRPALGLPDREREEEIVWYHFQRLVRSSKEVYLLWQSAVGLDVGGLEGKATRSRFVERLLWEQEQRQGQPLEGEVERLPLRLPASCFKAPDGLKKDRGQVAALLPEVAKKGLSPSLLNTYLECPLRFHYRYVLGLEPPQEVLEEADAGLLGQIVHNALEDYFRPYIGRPYRPAEADPQRLLELFSEYLDLSPLGRALAPERRFLLEEVARFRLRRYLEGIEEEVWPESVERVFRLRLSLPSGQWAFYGKVDRVDRRGDVRVVLDYKTGLLRPPGATTFLERTVSFSPPEALDYDGLRAVKSALDDLQLPLYVLLASGGREEELKRLTAAYVLLAEDGREHFLLPPKRLREVAPKWVKWFQEGFPAVLDYLLRHILEAPLYFKATDAERCRTCEYEPSCPWAW